MTITDTEKIDFASLDPRTDELILTITDHLDWREDSSEHLMLLQEKFNTYLRFVESGEVYEQLPLAVGRKIRFQVIGKYPLSEAAKSFYAQATSAIVNAGFALRYQQYETDRSA